MKKIIRTDLSPPEDWAGGRASSSLCLSDCSLKLCDLRVLGARLSVRSMLFSNLCWILCTKLMLLPSLVVLNRFSRDLKALVASWMCESHVLLSLLDPA